MAQTRIYYSIDPGYLYCTWTGGYGFKNQHALCQFVRECGDELKKPYRITDVHIDIASYTVPTYSDNVMTFGICAGTPIPYDYKYYSFEVNALFSPDAYYNCIPAQYADIDPFPQGNGTAIVRSKAWQDKFVNHEEFGLIAPELHASCAFNGSYFISSYYGYPAFRPMIMPEDESDMYDYANVPTVCVTVYWESAVVPTIRNEQQRFKAGDSIQFMPNKTYISNRSNHLVTAMIDNGVDENGETLWYEVGRVSIPGAYQEDAVYEIQTDKSAIAECFGNRNAVQLKIVDTYDFRSDQESGSGYTYELTGLWLDLSDDAYPAIDGFTLTKERTWHDMMIRTVSQVTIGIGEARAMYGATIRGIVITAQNSSGQTVLTGTIQPKGENEEPQEEWEGGELDPVRIMTAGETEVTVTIIDSRNAQTVYRPEELCFTTVDYKRPSFITVDQYRVDRLGQINGVGNYFLRYKLKTSWTQGLNDGSKPEDVRNRMYLTIYRTGYDQKTDLNDRFPVLMREQTAYVTGEIDRYDICTEPPMNEGKPTSDFVDADYGLFLANNSEYRIRYVLTDDVGKDMALEEVDYKEPMGTGALFLCMDPEHEAMSIGCYLQSNDKQIVRLRDDISMRVGGRTLEEHIRHLMTEYFKQYRDEIRSLLGISDGLESRGELPEYPAEKEQSGTN